MDTVLKHKRKSEGLTQVEVAKKTKLAERVYQRYESGQCVPNAYTAVRLAKALNSTVEELFPIDHLLAQTDDKQHNGN